MANKREITTFSFGKIYPDENKTTNNSMKIGMKCQVKQVKQQ